MAIGKKTGGRKAGTPNKASSEIKKVLTDFMTENMDDLQDCVSHMKAVDRFDAYMQIMKFVVPTMKAVEMTVDSKMLKTPVIIQLDGKDPTEKELREL